MQGWGGGDWFVHKSLEVQEYLVKANLHLCSADGSTHTESNKLYRKVKHRARPTLSQTVYITKGTRAHTHMLSQRHR